MTAVVAVAAVAPAGQIGCRPRIVCRPQIVYCPLYSPFSQTPAGRYPNQPLPRIIHKFFLLRQEARVTRGSDVNRFSKAEL